MVNLRDHFKAQVLKDEPERISQIYHLILLSFLTLFVLLAIAILNVHPAFSRSLRLHLLRLRIDQIE